MTTPIYKSTIGVMIRQAEALVGVLAAGREHLGYFALATNARERPGHSIKTLHTHTHTHRHLNYVFFFKLLKANIALQFAQEGPYPGLVVVLPSSCHFSGAGVVQ